jgi:hypothetical protein
VSGYYLPEGHVSVDARCCAGIDGRFRFRLRVEVTIPHVLSVLDDANEAVRVVSGHVRIRQVIGNGIGVRGGGSECLQQPVPDPDDVISHQSPHFFLPFTGYQIFAAGLLFVTPSRGYSVNVVPLCHHTNQTCEHESRHDGLPGVIL